MIQSLPSLTLALFSSDSKDYSPQHAANSVSTDNTQLEIIKLLKELQYEIKLSNDNHESSSDGTPKGPSDCASKGPYPKTPNDYTINAG